MFVTNDRVKKGRKKKNKSNVTHSERTNRNLAAVVVPSIIGTCHARVSINNSLLSEIKLPK